MLLISVLVAVHEYGHYIVGRWMGMKVLRFSIGFGKPIWMRKGGKDETEYCFSLIPLGGYVKFLDSREGTIESNDHGRAFDQRPIPARIAVLLAGPIFNFIFAILAYWLLMIGGITTVIPAVGIVENNSYADQAGLEFGDKIISVGDIEVAEWEGALAAILGEMVKDGRIPLTLENHEGLQRGVTLNVGSDKTLLTEPGALFKGLGFKPWQPPAIIAELPQDGPANNSGLMVGDQIISIADESIISFEDLRVSVQSLANEEVIIEYVRGGQLGSVNVKIGERKIGSETQGYLGVSWSNNSGEGFYKKIPYTPMESLISAVNRTWSSTTFTVNMLSRMLIGDVSIKNISGPIKIAQIAGESAERGWRYFVSIMAVISISLGVLNLFPIPILDGGQILYHVIEGLKGSPMTEKAQILGQQVGIFLVLILMSFAFYNDISGIFS
jgi:regulator of sigma E protease